MIHSLAIKTMPYTPSDGIFRVSGLQLRGAVRGKINPMSALPTSKIKSTSLVSPNHTAICRDLGHLTIASEILCKHEHFC